MFDELGVRLLATKVRRRLCDLGATRSPRGPVDDTRVNPVGLTIREAATHAAELGALDAQDR